MSDQALRRLEREVRAGGSDDVVLRWSSALERAERLDETLAGRSRTSDRVR